MAFENLCSLKELHPGDTATFFSGEREIIVIWPHGGSPKAYEGLCPHQLVSLKYALFRGNRLMCQLHRWTFDGATGRGLPPHFACLKPFALRIEGDAVLVDVEGAPEETSNF